MSPTNPDSSTGELVVGRLPQETSRLAGAQIRLRPAELGETGTRTRAALGGAFPGAFVVGEEELR